MDKLVCSECFSEYFFRPTGTTRGPGAFACIVCGEAIFLWSQENSLDYEFTLVKAGSDEYEFEVLPAEEMRNRYGLFAENRPTVSLNPVNVPTALQSLIPFAEYFGVSDDLIRSDVLRKAPPEKLQEMREAVHRHEMDLEAWLAGPAAEGPNYSAEYIAFSALVMAADSC